MGDNLIILEDANDHQETRHQLSTGDLKVFTYDELNCVTMGFGYKTRLGDWSFGKVYKGWVDEKNYSPTEHGTGLAVVIKAFDHDHSEYIKSKMDLVLKKLSHPNLVKLIGYCFEDDLLFLVDEFYYGNLEDCVRYGAMSRLPLDTKVKMALGIARAIVFLHQTHQTASSHSCADQRFLFDRSNILLDEDFTPKLSDYNVSTFRPWLLGGLDNNNITHPTHNPPPSIIGWTNVISFTMVLAEIITGEAVSKTNPLVKMNHLRHTKEILNDPKSLGSVANLCFEICNDVDSEYRMQRLLKKFNKDIPT